MVFSAFPATFDAFSVVNGESIGWIQVYSCNESSSSTFTYSNGQSAADFFQFFEHVIAVQFLADDQTPTDYDFDSPTDGFAVMTDICSIPVISLNNNLDLSWPIDVDTLSNDGSSIADNAYIDDNWLGSDTALARLVQNGCAARDPQDIYDVDQTEFYMYWACGNLQGIHLTRAQCSWDYQTDLPNIDGLSLWFGFAAKRDRCCIVENSVSLLSATDECPSITTSEPTENPTSDPTNRPTSDPTAGPTLDPTAGPTTDPTADPTSSPTLDGCDFDLETYLEECYCDGLQSGLNYGSAHNGYYSNNNINDNEFKDKYYELLSKYQEISDYKYIITALVFTNVAVIFALIVLVICGCIMVFNKNKTRYGHKRVDFDDDTDHEEQQPFN